MTESPFKTDEPASAKEFPRCGTVVLAGRSNVGKSTLLNRWLGAKVAITSAKPQTTRSRILGIRTLDNAQMILLDTPGLHRARSLLNRRMVEVAAHSILEADVVVVVIDGRVGITSPDREAVRRVVDSARPWLLAVNKIDSVERRALLPLLAAIGRELPEIDVVPISAATGENLGELERCVAARLPAGEPLYPADELTDQTARTLVQEFVREQIFAVTEGEVPYRTAVLVERFEEKPNVDVVSATILVERDSQKRILVGAGGATIRRIGSGARRELERFFDKRFFLELFVKVRRDWSKSPHVLNELGL